MEMTERIAILGYSLTAGLNKSALMSTVIRLSSLQSKINKIVYEELHSISVNHVPPN